MLDCLKFVTVSDTTRASSKVLFRYDSIFQKHSKQANLDNGQIEFLLRRPSQLISTTTNFRQSNIQIRTTRFLDKLFIRQLQTTLTSSPETSIQPKILRNHLSNSSSDTTHPFTSQFTVPIAVAVSWLAMPLMGIPGRVLTLLTKSLRLLV